MRRGRWPHRHLRISKVENRMSETLCKRFPIYGARMTKAKSDVQPRRIRHSGFSRVLRLIAAGSSVAGAIKESLALPLGACADKHGIGRTTFSNHINGNVR